MRENQEIGLFCGLANWLGPPWVRGLTAPAQSPPQFPAVVGSTRFGPIHFLWGPDDAMGYRAGRSFGDGRLAAVQVILGYAATSLFRATLRDHLNYTH